ncbi:MAG: AI-2E family transporter [Atopobiaceae bacterium]|jgi:predicted PurR-regulated permease PerM|nr:AI-2E family transporter [Atopobiaceae bacterium]MCI1318307.1 AI-2E family transporter [Atopobiaceae bacterium]MCI1388238.1 AI-2E family transporter [Atopobiaceae bacterium]MCI1431512.1 AI-2E family transporter [Atopobiaceae bacterium]MCI1469948.1 AI-2E family transporter [Atopobiaceae bacterium]
MAPKPEDSLYTKRPSSYYEAKNVAYRAWAIVGCVVVFVLAVRGLGLIVPAIELLLVGIVVGFMCSPITNWLEDHGLPRSLAAFLALVMVVAILTIVLWMFVPSVINETLELLRRTPYFIAQARSVIDGLISSLGSSQDGSSSDALLTVSGIVSTASSSLNKLANQAITKLSQGLIPLISGTISNLFTFFLGLVLAFWLARDYPVIFRELSIIAGPDRERDITLLFAVLSRSMSGYMRSTLYTAIIAGVLSWLGYLLVGHPYAGLMGITMGVLHVIPVVGPWVAAALAVLLGLFASPAVAIWTLIVAVVAMNVTDNLIGPVVMQSAVQVHPILSLVAITVGASLGGIVGMIVAVPLSAAIKGGYIYYFELRTGRQLVAYDGALFKSTPFADDAGEPVPSLDALDDEDFFAHSRLVPVSAQPEAAPAKRPEGMRDAVTLRLLRKAREAAPVQRAGDGSRGDASQGDDSGGDPGDDDSSGA